MPGKKNAPTAATPPTSWAFPGVAVLVSLLAFIFLSARTHLAQARLGDYVVSTTDLSKVLFRDLLLPFEVTSVLILIAILGAVALASKEH